MIEIKNVTVAYETQTNESIIVLDDVSTTVETGQWVSIIGPSGSGKTSFLKLIGGLLVPAKGTVVIDEKNIYQMKENQKKSFRHTKVSLSTVSSTSTVFCFGKCDASTYPL
jgi:putative ABC transport system ATP-binding protein